MWMVLALSNAMSKADCRSQQLVLSRVKMKGYQFDSLLAFQSALVVVYVGLRL
jgi:hypothetical protein